MATNLNERRANNFTTNDEYGYIYLLKNDWMPGLLKIGYTDNIKERMRTLYNTSVPVAFSAIHVAKVKKEEMRRIEETLHYVFSQYRVNIKREFFQMEEDKALRILNIVELEDVTNEVNGVIKSDLEPEDIRALAESDEMIRRARRPNLNFHLLNIQNNERLYWKDDETKFVTIFSERKVVLDGETCSLTAATQKLLGITTPIAPSPYWLYNGRLLLDIYNEFYTPIDDE